MVDILHRVGVSSTSTDEVFEALTRPERLAGWWTQQTRGDGASGGLLEFRFDGNDGFDMQVLEAEAGDHVLWEVVDGPDEWRGTTIRFDLEPSADETVVRFKHEGWRAPTDMMHNCSTKWGVFMLSLKALLETGTGAPYPADVKIDSGN